MSQEGSRFSLDSSLGRLARFLRMLGIDAAWNPGDGLEIALSRARNERRVLLTRSGDLKRLGMTWPPAGGQRVLSDTLTEQLSEVGRCWPIFERSVPFSRCPVCNELLHVMDPDLARSLVPPYVASTRTEFKTCASCSKVFWDGTHTARVMDVLQAAAARISKQVPIGEGARSDENPAPSE